MGLSFEKRSAVGATDETKNCGNCIGACCKSGMYIVLSGAEAIFMRKAGTVLEQAELARDADVRWPVKYQMKTDCGHLKVNEKGQWLCSVHEDPERPFPCQAFQPGSPMCGIVRKHYGVDKE